VLPWVVSFLLVSFYQGVHDRGGEGRLISCMVWIPGTGEPGLHSASGCYLLALAYMEMLGRGLEGSGSLCCSGTGSCVFGSWFEPLGFPGNLSHLHAGLFRICCHGLVAVVVDVTCCGVWLYHKTGGRPWTLN
jgi:hypothetical protein